MKRFPVKTEASKCDFKNRKSFNYTSIGEKMAS